jgi:hypothetical protein
MEACSKALLDAGIWVTPCSGGGRRLNPWIGSALRRYGLSSIGLVTEDDDANAVCISPLTTSWDTQNQRFCDGKVPPFNGKNSSNPSLFGAFYMVAFKRIC